MKLTDKITETYKTTKQQQDALKRLNLETLHDLLYHFPVRYSDISRVTAITNIQPNETVTILGTIHNPDTKKSFKKKIPMGEATIEDINGDTLSVVWFHQAFVAKQLNEGETVKLTGKVTKGKQEVSLTNPEVERIPDLPIDHHDSLFGESTEAEFGYPVYPESRGVTSKWFYHTIRKLLESGITEQLDDPIPEDTRKRYSLPSIHTALFWIHMPKKEDQATAAQKRFSFEEIFAIQTAKQQARYDFEQRFSYQLSVDKERLDTFVNQFPFTPTDAQMRSIDAIVEDMTSESPMARLLEGDVGSGKTFVASVVSYAVTQNRPRKEGGGNQDFGALQVAYMAPTEVLATQLFENFIENFRGTGTQIALITGSGCRKFPSKVASNRDTWTNISRNQLLKWVKNGEIPIVVGTHALISKKVTFKDLGLVIVDEQHRFGTNQRKNLAEKDARVPHYLSMTATPIPRTLALTIYGDLNLSVIDEMPAGRKPVQTDVVRPDKREGAYEHIRNELSNGRQAYIICPRINQSDDEDSPQAQLKSVTEEAERVGNEVFTDSRIGIMHSKMSKKDKENIMNQFYNHELDILVSTSVVEVGVNVPNANMIVIEGAERFGLAQLHQLRGRVLRGTHQAYCYLFTSDGAGGSEKTADRLNALAQSHNGFELAEMDLSMRGTGDLAGRKQWGVSDLAMEAIKNPEMVEAARNEARAIVEGDPELHNHLSLTHKITKGNYAVHFE